MENGFDTNFIVKERGRRPLKPWFYQLFLKDCFKANGNLKVQILVSKKWRERKGPELMQVRRGKKTLYIPRDLCLWQIPEVVKTIDVDTFEGNPERQNEGEIALHQLGKKFEQAGIYIAIYSQDLKEGQEKAQAIARHFYEYGTALQTGVSTSTDFEAIKTLQLTEEEKTAVEEWLLGKSTYSRRSTPDISNVKTAIKSQITMASGIGSSKETNIESKRKRLFAVIFRYMSREGFEKVHDKEPWKMERGIIKKFQMRARENIVKAIQMPERALITSIFRRGIEELKKGGMKVIAAHKNVGITHPPATPLYEALHNDITRWKSELEESRSKDDKVATAALEKKIAYKIQKIISTYPYPQDHGLGKFPTEIAETQERNCLGACLQCGPLLEEAGIHHLYTRVPHHALLLLITADNKIYWFDPQSPINNREIRPEDIEGGLETIHAILTLNENKEAQAQSVTIKAPWYRAVVPNALPWEQGQMRIHKFSQGAIIDMLGHLGDSPSKVFHSGLSDIADEEMQKRDPQNGALLYQLGKTKNKTYLDTNSREALDPLRKAIELWPDNPQIYQILAYVFYRLQDHSSAILTYEKAFQLDPHHPENYLPGIADAYFELQHYQKAVEIYEVTLKQHPGDFHHYSKLGEAYEKNGQADKALEAYKTFLKKYKGNDLYTVNQIRKKFPAL